MPATDRVQYKVYVDDNYHYMDESARVLVGGFDDYLSAVAKCKELVDAFLLGAYRPGMTADQLLDGYRLYGEDPFIVTTDAGCEKFSAWSYAERRCEELCRAFK